MNEIYGAVIGDIVGSTYEIEEMEALKKAMKVPYAQRIKVMDCDFSTLFRDGSEFTDDTILTVAIANAILTNTDYEENLKEFEGVGCCTDICINNGFIGLANYLDQINRIHNIIVHEDAIATYNEDNRKEYVEAAKLLMKQQGIQLVKKK